MYIYIYIYIYIYVYTFCISLYICPYMYILKNVALKSLRLIDVNFK